MSLNVREKSMVIVVMGVPERNVLTLATKRLQRGNSSFNRQQMAHLQPMLTTYYVAGKIGLKGFFLMGQTRNSI